MQAPVAQYLAQTKLGAVQIHGSLVMFPVLSAHETQVSYLTLDEALEDGQLEITEVSDGGHVPRLLLKNPSGRRILILDGEELIGAKQNRIVNTSILVAIGATLEIPVSCVEQGRWSYASNQFGTQRRMMFAGLRAAKADQVLASVRMTGTYDADQSAIWSGIDARSRRHSVRSETRAMADLYDQSADRLEGYVRAFVPVDGQVGAVFALRGKVVGAECYGRSDTLAKVFPKLLQSYALDAIDADAMHAAPAKVTRGSAARFLQAVARAKQEEHASVGEGRDLRLESRTLTGLGLCLDDQLLHLSAFRRAPGTSTHGTMARFSQRRR